ncbi:MAG: nucleotidyltransferase domain-containing protein [Myxococcota bacterium]|nr:nucleotidyltransferase domain-containing protein [Myxococcota bacterium]
MSAAAADSGARTIQRVLAADPAVRLAYLFGSQARGAAGPRSDWDVAVLVDPSALKRRWPGAEIELADALADALGSPVDVVLLNTAPPVLAHEVLRDGDVLVEREPGERTRFEMAAMRRYLDTRPLRQIRDRAVSERLSRPEGT